MLEKEIRDTLRQTSAVLIFLLTIPLFYLADRILYRTGIRLEWYIVHGFGYVTLGLAVYLSIALFLRERRDGAREYLHSLPMGRGRILACKILPRLLVLIACLGVNQILVSWRWEGGPGLYSHPLNAGLLNNAVWLTTMLCFGFILSVLGRRAWVTQAALAVMMLQQWSVLINGTGRDWSIARNFLWEPLCRMRDGYMYNYFQLPLNHAVRRYIIDLIPWQVRPICRCGSYPPLTFQLDAPVADFVWNHYELLECILLTALVMLAFLMVFRTTGMVPTRTDQHRFLRRAALPFLLVAFVMLSQSLGFAGAVRIWMGYNSNRFWCP